MNLTICIYINREVNYDSDRKELLNCQLLTASKLAGDAYFQRLRQRLRESRKSANEYPNA
ncbi:hypothetical protein [Chamaesiphon sp. GL140_3_metabinner_50]|uniref:hypothetical protein n=1 Tax=Chamaesiphon sp. GL140_3_metabinner_50 TaxID=2970812 RepID=UPI0025FF16F7|nr:hypothetical protein [Chamaesiphon sp. GL140_3_metabinner_50]